MKIAIWWNIPCKSIVPVARELANIENTDVTFISQSDLSQSRKQLGWELPDFGKAKYIVLPENEWKNDVEKLILDNYDIHIFNGVYLFPKVRYALDFAKKEKVPFGVISEAYHNPYSGYKRILKTIFTRFVTPFRVFPRIKSAKFVLGASGNNIDPFLHLGWDRKQFFPFGYFPENTGLEMKQKVTNEIPTLLCTGYITKNKGQHLLLEALADLKKENIEFNCIITGFGPEEENVKKLASKLDLDDCVDFVGVVSDKELNTIKAKTDLLVAPGIEEPWGIRINEALLAHTPVIVSDGIGASELISLSGAGSVFKSGNVKSLYKALYQLLTDRKALENANINAKNYSVFIQPYEAAKYILEVIKYTLNREEKHEVPFPSWLKNRR